MANNEDQQVSGMESGAQSKPMFTSIEDATEAYKNMQRQLTKSQTYSKEAMLTRFEVDDLMSRMDDLTETVRETRGSSYDDDDDDSPFKALDTRSVNRKQAKATRRAISELLMDNDLEWSDPRLEHARDLYDSDQPGGIVQALAAVKNFIGGETGDDLQSQIDAAVTEALRKRGSIDGGDTSSNGSVIPNDPDQLRAKLMDKKWVHEHREELLMAAKARARN
jgi:hypothetical protein